MNWVRARIFTYRYFMFGLVPSNLCPKFDIFLKKGNLEVILPV